MDYTISGGKFQVNWYRFKVEYEPVKTTVITVQASSLERANVQIEKMFPNKTITYLGKDVKTNETGVN